MAECYDNDLTDVTAPRVQWVLRCDCQFSTGEMMRSELCEQYYYKRKQHGV